MNKNGMNYLIDPNHVSREGTGFNIAGTVLAIFGGAAAIITIFNGGGFGAIVGTMMAVVGLLFMAVGHLKQIAAATHASYKIQYDQMRRTMVNADPSSGHQA